MFLSRSGMLGIYFFAFSFFCISAEKEKSPNPVFNFNFQNASGKKEIEDVTGRVKCISKNGNFVVQDNVLRLAPGSEIYIPTENLPRLKDELTVCSWILKRGTGDYAPIFFKGELPSAVDFLFAVSWRYPSFSYQKNDRSFKGVSIRGVHGLGGGGARYDDENWVVPGAGLIESGGIWKHVSAVFDRGNVRIYVDGQLTAERKCTKNEVLSDSAMPLYIGAEKTVNEKENYVTADMLLNNLMMYDKALNEKQINAIYEKQRSRYPQITRLPSGINPRNAFAPCYEYIKSVKKDYDPEFKTKLMLTKEYEKNIPSDPFTSGTISASVKQVNGQNLININNQVYYPIQDVPLNFDYVFQEDKIKEMGMGIRDFAAAGIDLIAVHISEFSIDDGVYDWDKVDNLLEEAIRANPKALIMVYIRLDSPAWFDKKYPDEVEQCYYGKQKLRPINKCGQLGSEKWFEVSNRMSRDLVTHIESGKWGGHIYAYLPGGGQGAEWYWPGTVTSGFSGYSKGTLESFRNWLKKKYDGDNELLRKSWKFPGISFNNAEVPSPEDRMSREGKNLFLNPEKFRQVFDFREFLNDSTFRHINETAKTIKNACSNKKLVFTYSGYCVPVTSHKVYASGLQTIHEIFSSPYIDCIVSLTDYSKRRGGTPGLNHNPFNGTASLCGKILWQEDDLRTYLHTKMESGRTSTLTETLEVIKRDLGYSITKCTGMWWLLFDNSWFHQEDIMRTVAKIKKAADKSISACKKSVSETAIIFDEKTPSYLSYMPNNFIGQHTWGAYEEAIKMGAPFDMYLMDDIKNVNMPDYKLYIFLNAYYVDEFTRKSIENKVRKNNAVSVWCYASGYISDSGFSGKSISELTGIQIDEIKEEKYWALELSDRNSDITKFMPEKFPKFNFMPAFYVTDDKAKILGKAQGKTVLAVKEFQTWRSVYSLMPLTKELMMGLCRYAGVHIYSRSFDVLSANKSYMMFHTSSDGEKKIFLKNPSDVKEIISGDVLGKGVTEISEKLQSGVTRIYEIIDNKKGIK